MGENTTSEWATHTFNAWEGCTKVSPGCANCYAEARNRRFGGGVSRNWGPDAPRRLTAVSTWLQVERWNRLAAGAAERPRVFVNSLSDWLDAEVDPVWLGKLLDVARRCEHLDFLLLTKRPHRWRVRVQAAHDALCASIPALGVWLSEWLDGSPRRNVWVGTTVEDQRRMLQRHRDLMIIPSPVHFWSAEPLLTALDVKAAWTDHGAPQWVIVGGESGYKARSMHPNWVRSLRDECAAAGVPFLFKQWGEWAPGNLLLDGADVYRAGKKVSGRLLDGVEHNEFPEVRS